MLGIVHRNLLGRTLSRLTNGVRFFSVSRRTRETDESTQHPVPSSQKSGSDVSSERKLPVPPPPPPLELCCMSGCQNCVMIQHAEELLKFYDDDTAARAALEEIPDENLKTFLKLELNLK